MSVLTRKISITIHEEAYLPLQQLATNETDSNVNMAVRLIIYQELVRKGHMSTDTLVQLYSKAIA